ncbi:Fc.00g028150.m01.CDS01 [Cosmosporella sp. VM-42]
MPPRHPDKGTAAAAKLRRSHRKSRNGCLECKRRHIKCDEARPSCSNCVVSERTCSFPPGATPSGPGQPRIAGSEVQSPAESSTSSTVVRTPSREPLTGFPMDLDDEPAPQMLPSFTESYIPSPSSSHQDPAWPRPTFTGKHLALLHYAETTTETFMLGSGLMRPIIDIAIDWAVDAPYALDQLLALCADNLALMSPENATTHRHTATELQTRALMWFNREAQNLTDESSDKTCVPRFLFASLLSVHVLFELFSHYRDNIHVFIDKFADSIHLHRGVRAIISETYHLILESGLRRFLLEVRDAEPENIGGTECAELQKFIESSDLGPTSVSGCKQAVQSLQWAFNLHAALPDPDNTRAGTAFPVLLTTEFVDALRKRRPEALIVLAHYGVLLHRCRTSWIFGDAGAFLIHLIADYLGSFWQEPMQWPLEVLRLEQG